MDLFYNNPKDQLEKLVNEIRLNKPRKSKYDCIIGLSGGVDSSYVALKIKELGLNPLAVHLDNGWNSNEATINIRNIIKKLNIDLVTYVIDWEEFRKIQKAYFKASVIDIEILTDHAINTVLFKMANKYNLKYILSGTNFATESVLPDEWFHDLTDHVNIQEIISKNSDIKIKTYPLLSWVKRNYYTQVKKIRIFNLLNYIHYNKEVATKELEECLDYVKYSQKHFESIFTRFYQGYILPVKFGVDKRVAHLSSLVLSEAITREEGLNLLANNEYDEVKKKQDYDYVRKKLGFSEKEFSDYFKSPPVSHLEYKTEKSVKDILNLFKR